MTRRPKALLLVVLAWYVHGEPCAAGDDVFQFQALFRAAVRTRNPDAVAEFCQRRIRDDPEDLVARSFLGAREGIRRLHPPDGRAPSEALLAYSEALAGDLPRALAGFRTALESRQDSAVVFRLAQRSLFHAARSGSLPRAEPVLRDWAHETVDSEWPYLLLSEMHRLACRPDQALAALRSALELSPKSAVALSLMGWRVLDDGRSQEAGVWFRNALESDPRAAQALAGLARIELVQGEPRNACRIASDALEIDPGLSVARQQFAEAFAQVGQIPEACTQFDAALALDPGDPDIRFHYARLLEERGEAASAQIQWQAHLRLAIESPRSWRVANRIVEVARSRGPRGQFPAWAPDGRHIAIVRPAQDADQLVIADPESPESGRVVPLGIEGRLGAMDWSPDGRLLAIHVRDVRDKSGEDGVYIKDLSMDFPAFRRTAPGWEHPRFSPDGQQILLSSASREESGTIDLQGQSLLTRIPLSSAVWSPDDSWLVGEQRYSAERGDLWLFRLSRASLVGRLSREHLSRRAEFHPAGHVVTFLQQRPIRGTVVGAAALDGRSGGEVFERPLEDAPVHQAWSPDGNCLMVGDRDGRIILHRMGGIDVSPIAIHLLCDEGRLVVSLSNRSDQGVRFRVLVRVYDADSRSVQFCRLGGGDLFLPAQEKRSWAEWMEPESLAPGTIVRVEVLSSDGRRAVRLWSFTESAAPKEEP